MSITAKPFTVGFVTDPSLSREKTQIALRSINTLRGIADVRYYPGTLVEEELLKRITRDPLDLLLVPWHMYLHFQKIEAKFGLTRLHGPTMVGYFAEDISPHEIQEEDHHFRAMLIDLNRLSTPESSAILRALLRDSTRWGLKPLMQPNTPFHYETWSAQMGLGFRIDAALSLPELKTPQWSKRANAIRTLICAFWSIVFDNGPGKMDRDKSGANRTPRGYFEIAADTHGVGLRLCYTEPGWKAKDVLHQFWPGAGHSSTAGQILCQYSDFLRIHVDPETAELEIVCMLYPSSPSEMATDILKTIWIEPLTSMTRLERFFDTPESMEEHHRLLQTRHDALGNSFERIDELKAELDGKEKEIEELRSKGNVRENVFIYPNGLDGDALVDLINRRMAEMKAKIKSLNQQLGALHPERGDDLKEASRIMQEIRDITSTQKTWISRLTSIVGSHLSDTDDGAGTVKTDEPKFKNDEEEALSVVGTQERQPRVRRPLYRKGAYRNKAS